MRYKAQRIPELRFSATLGQVLEVDLAQALGFHAHVCVYGTACEECSLKFVFIGFSEPRLCPGSLDFGGYEWGHETHLPQLLGVEGFQYTLRSAPLT